jgi:hypothetical protein
MLILNVHLVKIMLSADTICELVSLVTYVLLVRNIYLVVILSSAQVIRADTHCELVLLVGSSSSM